MRHSDGRAVAVPVHSSRDVPKGTLRAILASIGMTPDEFRALL
jgi:predicted RNA binding protein YcfA (HicA-like mRNA interferase family)